ncbi:hypothetical protein CAEBREN_06387 [Caenorhabditis brenneri]|uniref:Uncharacterized protein n=1 Tax=Caenorhabditis brenneri TaxID=135651 RepID=G0PEP0_CAEBE|nr:hypothetical protein CAEBREN_06387 [Caenorhabditis brenneri]
MDDTQRSAAGSNSSSMRVTEGDTSIERLAPVSMKGSQKIHKVFHELIDNWKKYTAIEDGDRIAALLQNYTVEKQIEHMQEMQKDEIIDIIRFNLRKITTLQEENEQLTRRNRDISERLHRVEHRVGKAQVEVFGKIQETTMDILKEFHARELELSRKAESLEAEKVEHVATIAKQKAKIEEFERQTTNLETKNRRLIELNEENEKKVAELSLKNQTHETEIFHLREQLVKATELSREKTEEALQEAMEAQRAKALIFKERETANLEVKRHEGLMQKQMDEYKDNLEREINSRQQRHKKEVEALNAKFESAVNYKDAVIRDLTQRNQEAEAEIQKFKRNFEMMEAQIKGNMKRKLALNYHEMMDIISSSRTGIPEPPRENPFLNFDNFEKENRKHRLERSPSPKRTLGVQTADRPSSSGAPPLPKARNPEPLNQRKSSKFSSSVSSGRFPSTSSRK